MTRRPITRPKSTFLTEPVPPRHETGVNPFSFTSADASDAAAFSPSTRTSAFFESSAPQRSRSVPVGEPLPQTCLCGFFVGVEHFEYGQLGKLGKSRGQSFR